MLQVFAQGRQMGRNPSRRQVSPRQVEILVLLSSGETYKAIAHRLNLSTATVSYHVGRLQLLFQTRSLPALVALAIVSGILTNNQWPLEGTGDLLLPDLESTP
jgi:DNA-binding CsgD family transcriptional regulator